VMTMEQSFINLEMMEMNRITIWFSLKCNYLIIC
jgi:hypothetical protein